MDNRFGFRDLVQAALLLAILVSIWIAMKQFDRQWDDLRSLREDVRALSTTQNQLRSQLNDMNAKLAQGVRVSSAELAAPRDESAHALDGIRDARAKPDFAEGDVLVDAFGTNVKTITAITYKDLYGRRIQGFILEGLAEQDEDTLAWEPLIAESWQIEDNTAAWQAFMTAKRAELEAKLAEPLAAGADPVYGVQLKSLIEEMAKAGAAAPADGTPEREALVAKARDAWTAEQIKSDPNRPPAMTITFQLRRDVRFSDGTPLTAHDVEYTWTLLNNPLVNAPETRNFYDNVESYKAIDDYAVRFTFREPHYMAFSMVAAFQVLPKHFYEKISVDDLNREPGLLMGSGPYRLEDPKAWAPGKLLKLIRNENYWGPRPGAAALIWLEIENDVSRLNAFKNGQIDLFSASAEQYVDLKKDPQTLEKYDAKEYTPIPSGYSFVAWNVAHGGQPTMFADKRVRQAMTYLIPRERIAQEVYLGLASPTSGPFDEGSKQADPQISARPYDPQKGLALLAEVGWRPGGDGVLRNPEGQPFAFTLTYPSGNDEYERVMLMIKDTLNSHGILMTQDPQEWSIFIERVDARNFDACALAWGGGAIEGDIRQMFHSSQIAGGANNFTSYRNAELDALIDQARGTIDEAERMKLWQACHRILYEDPPYTFMLRRKATWFLDKRVHNVQRVTTGINGRVEWYVPAPMQKRQP